MKWLLQEIEYDGSKFYGYIDFGSDSNHTLIAKEALVFFNMLKPKLENFHRLLLY